MRLIRFNKIKGMALGVVLIGLLAMLASIGVWYKSSELNRKLASIESASKILEITSHSHLGNIRVRLTHLLNQIIQARSTFDKAGDATAALNSIVDLQWHDSFKDFIFEEDALLPPFNTLDLSKLYQAEKNENLQFTINCLLNCNALQYNSDGSRAYPKRFSVQLQQMTVSNDAVLVKINSLIDVIPVSVNNYSTILTGASDNVVFGEGIHRKEGVFFDYAAYEARHPGKAPKIIFINPKDTTLVFEKLITNIDESGLEFGNLVPTGCCGSHQYTDVGEIEFEDGFLTGSSPVNDLISNFDELKERNTTFKGLPSDQISDCEVKLSCQSDHDCRLSFIEYDLNGDPFYLVQDINDDEIPEAVANNIVPKNNSVYFSASRDHTCRINSIDGTSLATYGKNNMTLMSNSSFTAETSIAPRSNLNESERGGALFVSFESDAIILNENTRTLTNQTLGSIYQSGGLNDDTLTIRLEIGMVSLAERLEPTDEGTTALKLSKGLITPGAKLGKLYRDGPAIGPETTVLRGFSNGNVVSGFNAIETLYGSHWLQRPPRGMEIQSATEHQGVIIAITNQSQSLSQALQDVGLKIQDVSN